MANAFSDNYLEGWIIKYNTPSVPWTIASGRKVYESIASNVFAESVAAINRGEYSIECNVEHTQDNALTRLGTTASNIKLEHRAEGVYFKMQLLNDTISNDIYARIGGSVVTGVSMEFEPPKQEPKYQTVSGGDYLRVWDTPLNLKGFAIVAAPKYPAAQVGITAEPATYKRSISASELEQIAAEIERIEKTNYWKYYALSL